MALNFNVTYADLEVKRKGFLSFLAPKKVRYQVQFDRGTLALYLSEHEEIKGLASLKGLSQSDMFRLVLELSYYGYHRYMLARNLNIDYGFTKDNFIKALATSDSENVARLAECWQRQQKTIAKGIKTPKTQNDPLKKKKSTRSRKS